MCLCGCYIIDGIFLAPPPGVSPLVAQGDIAPSVSTSSASPLSSASKVISRPVSINNATQNHSPTSSLPTSASNNKASIGVDTKKGDSPEKIRDEEKNQSVKKADVSSTV